MKYLFSIIMLVSTTLQAQVVAVENMPLANSSLATVSYVRTWQPVKPITDPVVVPTLPIAEVTQSTTFIDGLGRTIQTVGKQQSPLGKDMVSYKVYDAYGRETITYLPYESQSADGYFKTNPFIEQKNFYNTTPQYAGELVYYSKLIPETAPLGRIEKTMPPGNSWAGSGRGSSQSFEVNTLQDEVWIWNIVGDLITDIPTTNAFYPTGTLYKIVTTDEHGNKSVEYKDKSDKVILKKVQISQTPSQNHIGWLCTYYIYDIYANLRCVIQPEAVKQFVSPNPQLTTSVLEEQCFTYEYDHRNRMIKKKVPGAGEVCMVYDELDRLILMQDANMKNGTPQKWLYTKYDEMNRPVATGLLPSNLTQQQHASNSIGNLNYPTLSGQEELTNTFYNDYNWLSNHQTGLTSPATYNISYDQYFETANNTSPFPQANTATSQLKGKATGTRTKILGTGNYLYSIIFYDESGRIIQTQSTNITGGKDISTTQYTWAGQPYVIVQRVEKVGTPINETVTVTRMNYDYFGRVIKTEKKISNSLVNGGTMPPTYKAIAENKYNGLGQLSEKRLASTSPTTQLETEKFEYNIRGWLLGMNRGYAKADPLFSNNYFGFDLGYDKTNNNLIGNQTYTRAQYNGNIEGTVWRSKGDGEKRKFDYAYDAANRLIQADFTQYTGGTFNQIAGLNFNVKMGDGADALGNELTPNTAYDYNGNIKQMQQWGLKINTSSQIDNLKYSYISGSNKLKSVTDFNNDAITKLGDFKTGMSHPQNIEKATLTPTSTPTQFDNIIDYTYDVNGNMKKDLNKNIREIIYNHLNLPQSIEVDRGEVGGGGQPVYSYVNYTYDAVGNKLKKVVNDIANGVALFPKITLYLNGLTYEDDILQFVPQEEGRIRLKPADVSNGATFAYDYMLKDHLGNVRMVLTEEQKVDPYPAATLENATLATEKTFYVIPDDAATRVDKNNVTAYPTDNTTSPNDYIHQLSGSATKVGSSITLKVMAGDKFNVKVSSWYKTNNVTPDEPIDAIVQNLVSGFLSGVSGSITSSHGTITTTQIQNSGVLTPNINSFLGTQVVDASRPRAFLNWILFDEQFKFVSSSSGAEQVPPESAFGTAPNNNVHPHIQSDLPINANGYLYVFVSNETPNINVYFDNLQVTHTRGAILEETHYYPFGLAMAGISSKAAGGVENKKKYNGIEFENDLDLNNLSAQLRDLDPQTGKWWQIDPLTESMENWSPYVSNYDNPIRYEDHKGDTPNGCPPVCPGAAGVLRSAEGMAAQLGPYAEPVVVGGLIAATVYVIIEMLGPPPTLASMKASAANDPKGGIVVGNSYTMGTTSGNYTPKAEGKKFDGKADTDSPSNKAALRNAKDQNGIPRSQQPDKTIKPNTPDGDKSGLDNRNVKQYEYTNSKGEKVVIRQDKPATYPDGGSQGPHFNAGQNPFYPKDLNQHHNITIPFIK